MGVLLLHEFDITSACTASRNPVPSTVQADYYSKSWRGACMLYASIKHANATASLGAVRLQHGHPYSKQRSSTRPCHGKHCWHTNRAIYMQVDFKQDDSNMYEINSRQRVDRAGGEPSKPKASRPLRQPSNSATLSEYPTTMTDSGYHYNNPPTPP